jgi:hypothetical protein
MQLWFLLAWPLLPTHCRCRELLLHLVTHMDTYTLSRTSWTRDMARQRSHYLYSTQHSQEIKIQIPGGVRTQDLSKRAAAGLSLRPRDHWDRLSQIYRVKQIKEKWIWRGMKRSSEDLTRGTISQYPGRDSKHVTLQQNSEVLRLRQVFRYWRRRILLSWDVTPCSFVNVMT